MKVKTVTIKCIFNNLYIFIRSY